MGSNEVQIWNNAVFDNVDDSDHHSCKENRTPNRRKSCGPTKFSVFGKGDDLDLEIEKIEKEISRLSVRLESLRLEKKKRGLKMVEKRGRFVAAKFKEPPKQSAQTELRIPTRGLSVGPTEIMKGDRRGLSLGPNEVYSGGTVSNRRSCYWKLGGIDELGATKEPPKQSAQTELRTPRRGLSVGPAEIMKGDRRGLSLGPNEVYSDGTVSNMRSWYWKLGGIDELGATKERGKSLSVSPKSRVKIGAKSEAVSTSGVRKTVKKEDGIVQPKKLFVNEGKKPLKSGRVVSSRYNVGCSEGSLGNKEMRKRSLNGNEEDGSKRVKKKWEIPSEGEYKTPLSMTKMLDKVPKIRTKRVVNESPRDSGAAKRVCELVGRKPFFQFNDENEGLMCGNESFECSKIRLLGCVDESPRVSHGVGSNSFFDKDDDEMLVFSFEEES